MRIGRILLQRRLQPKILIPGVEIVIPGAKTIIPSLKTATPDVKIVNSA